MSEYTYKQLCYLNTYTMTLVQCSQCYKMVQRGNLSRHLNQHRPYIDCQNCGKAVREHLLEKHLIICRDNIDSRLCDRRHTEELPEPNTSSCHGLFRRFNLSSTAQDYDNVLDELCQEAKRILKIVLKANPVKAQFVLTLEFVHDGLDEASYTQATFWTICEPLLIGSDLDSYVERVKAQQKLAIENFERLGSGWQYDSFIDAKIEVAKYLPLSL